MLRWRLDSIILFLFRDRLKEVYGISPSHYQKQLLPLQNFDKPDLSLSHIVVEEGEPLISEGGRLSNTAENNGSAAGFQWYRWLLSFQVRQNARRKNRRRSS